MAKIIICKECGRKMKHKAFGLCDACYSRKRYAYDPEKARRENRERNRNWRKKNPDWKPNYHKLSPEKRWEKHLKHTFDITVTEYDEMLESQDGGCWVCGMSPEENGKRLAVDHDHETGEIRGLLCYGCNLMLGFAKDSPQTLARAIEYLLK